MSSRDGSPFSKQRCHLAAREMLTARELAHATKILAAENKGEKRGL